MTSRLESDYLMSRLKTKRTCDGCDLCCKAMEVYSLKKPVGVPCKHLCGEPGKNCSIYKDRPEDCYDFICLWRGSDRHMPQWAKPSNAGFVAALGKLDEFPPVLRIHPDHDRPTAWENYIPLLQDLAEKFNCIVAIGQGVGATHAIAPNGKIYSRAVFPIVFGNNGLTVGIPEGDFLPNRRTWLQMSQELWV